MRRPEQQPSLRNRPPAHRRIAYIHDASRMILQGRFAPRLTQLKKGYDSLPARPPRDANDTPTSPSSMERNSRFFFFLQADTRVDISVRASTRERHLPRFYVSLVLGDGFWLYTPRYEEASFRKSAGWDAFFPDTGARCSLMCPSRVR